MSEDRFFKGVEVESKPVSAAKAANIVQELLEGDVDLTPEVAANLQAIVDSLTALKSPQTDAGPATEAADTQKPKKKKKRARDADTEDTQAVEPAQSPSYDVRRAQHARGAHSPSGAIAGPQGGLQGPAVPAKAKDGVKVDGKKKGKRKSSREGPSEGPEGAPAGAPGAAEDEKGSKKHKKAKQKAQDYVAVADVETGVQQQQHVESGKAKKKKEKGIKKQDVEQRIASSDGKGGIAKPIEGVKVSKKAKGQPIEGADGSKKAKKKKDKRDKQDSGAAVQGNAEAQPHVLPNGDGPREKHKKKDKKKKRHTASE